MVVVLDANVLVKLFLDEPLSDIAEQVAAEHSLILAPDLVRLEVAGAITRKVRNGKTTAETARKKLDEWHEFAALGNLRMTPITEIQAEAEQLSVELRHSLGDCLYLVVARKHRIPLITADHPFVDAVAKFYSNIHHLSERAC